MTFEYASRASQGARAYQEDAAAVRTYRHGQVLDSVQAGSAPEVTAVLADGMGGHAGGALASQTACRTFLAAYDDSCGHASARLDKALKSANLAIAECVAENPALGGMGCTLVGTSFGSQGLEWISVGDSPLFLVRNSEIVLLNEDHSLAPEIDKLAAAGRISWKTARNDPRRHYLRSAITGAEIELVDRSRRPLALEQGDVVVMASDGIQTLASATVLSVVKAHAAEGSSAIADALISAVDAVGDAYQDNTTVVVVRFQGD